MTHYNRNEQWNGYNNLEKKQREKWIDRYKRATSREEPSVRILVHEYSRSINKLQADKAVQPRIIEHVRD